MKGTRIEETPQQATALELVFKHQKLFWQED